LPFLIATTWNLIWLSIFLFSGAAERLQQWMLATCGQRLWLVAPAYLMVFFALFAAVNFPLDFIFAFREGRIFQIFYTPHPPWSRDWSIVTAQHGLMFLATMCIFLAIINLFPNGGLAIATLMILPIFLILAYFEPDLLPAGLFEIQSFHPSDASNPFWDRLGGALDAAQQATSMRLPVLIFSHRQLHNFCGGLCGMGRRRVILLSQSMTFSPSDLALCYMIIREMGRARMHHIFISVLIASAYVCLGIISGQALLKHLAPGISPTTPLYLAWLALPLTAWVSAGHWLMIWIDHLLARALDRFYLALFSDGRAAQEQLHDARGDLDRWQPRFVANPAAQLLTRLSMCLPVFLRPAGRGAPFTWILPRFWT